VRPRRGPAAVRAPRRLPPARFPLVGPGLRGLLPGVLLAALLVPPGGAEARSRGGDGRYDQRRSRHFVLYQDVDLGRRGRSRASGFEREILAVLEAAFDRTERSLGLRPLRPIRVVVHDPAEFERRFAGLFPFPAAGFYQGTIHVRGAPAVDGALASVLHHEYIHAAFGAVAPGLVLPGWLSEGLAEWMGARARGWRTLQAGEFEALRRAAAAGELPDLVELSAPAFGGLPADRAGLAYLVSYALVQNLAHNHGVRRLRTFVAALLRSGDPDRALRRTYGWGAEDLERSFRSRLLH